ncbi:hypothetical protein J6590_042453 [Homalodisca vitripennis]|nr:hypothetical protein J6590_042453 [Homalodisca vitripennis]
MEVVQVPDFRDRIPQVKVKLGFLSAYKIRYFGKRKEVPIGSNLHQTRAQIKGPKGRELKFVRPHNILASKSIKSLSDRGQKTKGFLPPLCSFTLMLPSF